MSQLRLKKTTDGTRRGLKVPLPMSKGEISKAQALRLVAYITTLTKFLSTLTHISIIFKSEYYDVPKSSNRCRLGGAGRQKLGISKALKI